MYIIFGLRGNRYSFHTQAIATCTCQKSKTICVNQQDVNSFICLGPSLQSANFTAVDSRFDFPVAVFKTLEVYC